MDGETMSRRGDYLYQRKDGLWEARYIKEIKPDGRRVFGSVYAHTCQEAREKRQAKIEYYMFNPPPLTCAKNWTVQQLADEWLFVNRARLKPSTYQKYEGICRLHIFPIIGNQKVTQLTAPQLHSFALNRCSYGLKPQSVNTILVFLHSIFKYGHRQYRLPLLEIMYLPVEHKEIRVFSREEQRRLNACLLRDMDIYKFGVLVALYTGMRIGELCALLWSDIRDDCIYVRKTMQRLKNEERTATILHVGAPKTNTSFRIIPIHPFLKPYINRFRGDDLVNFLSTEDKPTIEPRVLQYRFQKILKEANIEDANFHTLRHTFASRCVACGFEIKALSEILGHANVQITLNKYVHPSLDTKRSNMEKLSMFR